MGEAVRFRCTNQFGAASVDHVAQVRELPAAIVEASEARGAFSAGHTGSKDYFLADANGGDIGADLRDFTRDVAPGNVRERDRNVGQALADPQVEAVQGASANVDQHFIGADDWIGRVHVFEDFGAAVLLELDGLHFLAPGSLEESRPVTTVATRSAPQSHGKLTKNLPNEGVR